jgi:CRISPR-associated protein Cst1
MPLLHFTGHPLADVGVATLCAMTGKEEPEALTLEDLDEVSRELGGYYFSGVMTSYLSCVFMNAEYVQPGTGKDKQRKRADYATRVLSAHRAPADEGARQLRCAYSGEPATHLVHRSQVPMLTGEDVLNFFPAGRGALPVAGPYLVAVQAVPMGGRRAEGRLLIAHSDDAELTLAFARRYVADNRRLLNLARLNKLPAIKGPHPELEREHGAKAAGKEEGATAAKYPDAKGPTSLVAADLLELAAARGAADKLASVTVYVMSNSGQGPSLAIYPIPSNLVRFLVLAGRAETRAAWQSLVARSWRDPWREEAESENISPSDSPTGRRKGGAKGRAKPRPDVPGGPGRSRNEALDDLFPIFESGFTDSRAARRFVARHLLRKIRWDAGARGGTGRQAGTLESPSLINWPMTALFLKEVLGMDAKRVERIREFADHLATHIADTNDRPLFRDLVFGRYAWEVRNALTKAQRDEAREKNRLLFGLQEYLDVFEADEAVGMADWSLVRDLVSIRLVESLHERGFFQERQDWLEGERETQEQ